jgi:hypothetical protein
MEERDASNVEVAGSSPARSSNINDERGTMSDELFIVQSSAFIVVFAEVM